MVSKASEDLPEPERPVTTVRVLRGMETEMFLRLCWRAPRTVMWVMAARGLGGVGDAVWGEVAKGLGYGIRGAGTRADGVKERLRRGRLVSLQSIAVC